MSSRLDLKSDFARTMSGLATGLSVRLVATYQMITCGHDELENAYARAAKDGLDFLPVTKGKRILGTIDCRREPWTGEPLQSKVRYLDEEMLISADAPLAELLSLLEMETPYRLVVDGGRIRAIVTRSDLLKLPTRLLAFSLATHLEGLMAELIESRAPDSADWLQRLTEGRRKKVLEKHVGLCRVRLDPPILECTDFCDKRDLVRKLYCPMPRGFARDLKRIETVRDTVAHGGDFVTDAKFFTEFLDTLRAADYWVDELSDRLSKHRRDEANKSPQSETNT